MSEDSSCRADAREESRTDTAGTTASSGSSIPSSTTTDPSSASQSVASTSPDREAPRLPKELQEPPSTGQLDEGSSSEQTGGGAMAVEQKGSDAEGPPEGTTSQDRGKGKDRAKAEDRFNCCICLDLAEDPVVTPCGHLSCWPCCHEWLVTSSKRTCPVCKAPVTVDRLIPIYSSSGEEQKDPREIPLPPRPRPAPPPPQTTSFFGIPFQASTLSSSLSSSSFSFQAGGMFPFSGMSMSYTYPPVDVHGQGAGGAGVDLRRGLVPGGEHEWLRQVFQQVFLVLFFAVFVMITFTG